MTCEHCQGPLNVPCYNGARVRCGCGKTIIDAPRPPELDLLALLAILREQKVRTYKAGGVEITLHPDAYRKESEATQQDMAPEVCACGHDVNAHTDSGCMNAECDPKLCEEWASKGQPTVSISGPPRLS